MRSLGLLQGEGLEPLSAYSINHTCINLRDQRTGQGLSLRHDDGPPLVESTCAAEAMLGVGFGARSTCQCRTHVATWISETRKWKAVSGFQSPF
jgi:hypothetical protein